MYARACVMNSLGSMPHVRVAFCAMDIQEAPELLSDEELDEALQLVPVKKNGYRNFADIPPPLIVQVIEAESGKIANIIERLNVRYGDFHMHLEKRTKLQTIIARYRNFIIDLAEDRLERNVKNGDQRAIEFVLDRLGKTRGYTKEVLISSSIDPAAVESKFSTMSIDQLRRVRQIMDEKSTESIDLANTKDKFIQNQLTLDN